LHGGINQITMHAELMHGFLEIGLIILQLP
jgi:hypothetical protein